MNPVQTGIAVALALSVVAIFFMFPGLSPLRAPLDAATDETSTIIMNEQTNEQLSGLQITEIAVGTGAVAESGDAVTATYTGMFPDGTVFDASKNHPEIANGFTFVLGTRSVIAGFDQGFIGMKEGGKRRLVIPPELGYGPAEGHPLQNQTLIFEIELLKVEKQSAQ